MIDSHCHLYSEEFADDINEVIQRSLIEGVTTFYLPAIDSTTHNAMISIEKKFSGKCYAMMGLHPCSVKENYGEELKQVETWLKQRKFAAIGETGLDFYWDKTFVREQYIALEKQIEWALEYKLPLVLHTRNAMQETIDVIKKYSAKGLKGIFHCFGGTLEEAKQVVETGFYMGIGGVVTYKNSGLDEVLKNINLEHLVLETDAPYLSPVPFRGKRNESSYLRFIAKKISEIKQISVEEVNRITTENAALIFNREK
ncbi:MAG: TatD family hydrolase [Ferruginibacter sp.]